VEKDGGLAEVARRRFGGVARVVVGDFLLMGAEELGGLFDFVISNPPYVSYERISPELRATYRRLFSVARGRFDLYMLFFEKALSLLRPGGGWSSSRRRSTSTCSPPRHFGGSWLGTPWRSWRLWTRGPSETSWPTR
jgi:hypothetical protein